MAAQHVTLSRCQVAQSERTRGGHVLRGRLARHKPPGIPRYERLDLLVWLRVLALRVELNGRQRHGRGVGSRCGTLRRLEHGDGLPGVEELVLLDLQLQRRDVRVEVGLRRETPLDVHVGAVLDLEELEGLDRRRTRNHVVEKVGNVLVVVVDGDRVGKLPLLVATDDLGAVVEEEGEDASTAHLTGEVDASVVVPVHQIQVDHRVQVEEVEQLQVLVENRLVQKVVAGLR